VKKGRHRRFVEARELKRSTGHERRRASNAERTEMFSDVVSRRRGPLRRDPRSLLVPRSPKKIRSPRRTNSFAAGRGAVARCHAGAVIDHRQEFLIGRVAHDGDEFLGTRINDASGPHEGCGSSVHHQWKSARPTPVGTVPLRDARHHVAVRQGHVFATKGQLPADLGLEGDVTLAVVNRHDV